VTVALTLTLAPLAARAGAEDDKKAARPHYEKGAVEYNLGHFAEAIAEFEKAYQLDRAPILLFNIAQAHRQSGNNERAAFFYRRYLEQAPTAANRPEVEKRIKDLDEAMRQQNDIKRRPPTEVANDDHEPPRVTQQADAATPPQATAPPPPPGPPPATAVAVLPAREEGPSPHPNDHHVRLALAAGPSFPKFSGRDLDQALLFSLRVSGAYRLDLAPLASVDVGLALTYTPLQYRTTDTNAERSAGFWGALVTGTLRYRVAPALDLQGELGAGIVWWSGLGDMNPFTSTGLGASSALALPTGMIGLGASYEIYPKVFVLAEPTLVFSKTGDGFANAVSSILRFDVSLGIGMRI
jgi:tetratricopeptide (TPR) repeat protein